MSDSPPGQPEIERIVAPNPGPMTLEGTNTYVVGRDPAYVIDPGPADAGHLDAVRAGRARGGIGGVLLTHSHADHSAGVARWAASSCWGRSERDDELEASRRRSPPGRRAVDEYRHRSALTRRAPSRSGRSRSCRPRVTPRTTSASLGAGSASAATSSSATARRSFPRPDGGSLAPTSTRCERLARARPRAARPGPRPVHRGIRRPRSTSTSSTAWSASAGCVAALERGERSRRGCSTRLGRRPGRRCGPRRRS